MSLSLFVTTPCCGGYLPRRTLSVLAVLVLVVFVLVVLEGVLLEGRSFSSKFGAQI